MWYRMMLLAFLANGFCTFGARVLEGMGLAKTHSFLYLAFWYTAGLLVSIMAALSGWRRFNRAELVIGAFMGLFSSLGWIFMTSAIAQGVPGYLVFPIAIGGNLSIVAAVGVLVFRERLSVYGYAGILCGVAGLAVISTI